MGGVELFVDGWNGRWKDERNSSPVLPDLAYHYLAPKRVVSPSLDSQSLKKLRFLTSPPLSFDTTGCPPQFTTPSFR